jgi:hypothetical protein
VSDQEEEGASEARKGPEASQCKFTDFTALHHLLPQQDQRSKVNICRIALSVADPGWEKIRIRIWDG